MVVLSLVALLLVAGWTHAQAVDRLQKADRIAPRWFVPSVSSLNLISLGFNQLFADCMWLQFIQYIGDSDYKPGAKNDQALAMLDDITTLDPHFGPAYFFTATIVGGEQHSPDAADLLLQRGIHANSSDWYIPFIAGINQYLFAHNEIQAAKYYKMAARFPDAPSWLARQSEILQARIPSSIKSINVWRMIFETAQDASIKQRAREELCALWVHVRNHAPPASIIRSRANDELARLGVTIFREKE